MTGYASTLICAVYKIIIFSGRGHPSSSASAPYFTKAQVRNVYRFIDIPSPVFIQTPQHPFAFFLFFFIITQTPTLTLHMPKAQKDLQNRTNPQARSNRSEGNGGI
jgi:hypothetical protein